MSEASHVHQPCSLRAVTTTEPNSRATVCYIHSSHDTKYGPTYSLHFNVNTLMELMVLQQKYIMLICNAIYIILLCEAMRLHNKINIKHFFFPRENSRQMISNVKAVQYHHLIRHILYICIRL